MNQFRKFVPAALAGGLFLASQANAAAIDVADIVTNISDQATPIGLIGTAVLGVIVAVAAFRWVRGALR